MEFLFIVAAAILIGSILGWVNFFQLRNLSQEVRKLRLQLATRKKQPRQETGSELAPEAEPTIAARTEAEISTKTAVVPTTDAEFVAEAPPSAEKSPDPWATTAYSDARSSAFMLSLKQNWMTWLGGFCVALAGIFLARYSIQQGLLGPTGRIVSGLATGFALHFSAEWLRRKTAENHLVFAMLAASGSITLFATLLASLHYYQMFSPMLVFVLLAIVATITLWLAMIHGPALAAMGMVGAYVVPLLVSTGSGNILAALLYSLVISASILFLLRYIYRYWLWIGLLVGGLLWWAISLDSSQADGWRGLYLAVFAYGLVSIVPGDWLLQQKQPLNSGENPLNIFSNITGSQQRLLPLSILFLCIAQCLTIISENNAIPSLLSLSPLAIIILLISNKQERFTALAWTLYLGQLFCLLFINVTSGPGADFVLKEISAEHQVDFFIFLTTTALLFSGLSIRNFAASNFKAWWSSLAILAPLFAMIVSYLLVPSYLEDWLWSLNAIVFGAFYIFLATRANLKQWDKAWTIWLFLAGHFAYTFAASLLLENAGLTLALAIQAISVAAIIKRFAVPELGWLLKVVVVLVVARLTLNPWLADYPTAMHWSIWTYGGATLCCYLAGRLLADFPKLASWAEAGTLHLLVLTLWVESRYWLYDGVVFIDEYTFTEAALNVSLFGALALVYHYKSQLSTSLTRLYALYGKLLMLFALANYGIILYLTLSSHSWVWKSISDSLLANLLLLGYLLPAIIGYLSYKYFDPQFKKHSAIITGLASFTFINLEIRHIWTGHINLDLPASDGEIYTYSVIWMLLAITAILSGSWRFGKHCYQAGMLLLAMVILKVFFIDMSQLDGIYRIIAFMGLGLSLLGIAYLHKRIGTAVFDGDT